MIYLDNAATTLRKPPQVMEAVCRAMETLGSAGRGAHECTLAASRTVYQARCAAAAFFHCKRPDHVVFTANATEALNIVLSGLFSTGDHIVTTDLEHNSVLRPLYRLEREGRVDVDFVPADAQGRIDYAAFDALCRVGTRAVVCTHVSNVTGDALDLRRIGETARSRGALFIVDASQSAGCLPVDMERMGIDALCFTGHKGLMGPQGTGGLCLREGVEVRPWNVGGSGVQSFRREQPPEYPSRLEAGTLNVHGIAGLAAALNFLQETGIENVHRREASLARRFYEGVRQIPGAAFYGDYSAEDRGAVVSLNLDGWDSGELSDALSNRYGIAVRPGVHCAPRLHTALGTVERGIVRFSFSYYNTEDEADAAAAAVRELSAE